MHATDRRTKMNEDADRVSRKETATGIANILLPRDALSKFGYPARSFPTCFHHGNAKVHAKSGSMEAALSLGELPALSLPPPPR